MVEVDFRVFPRVIEMCQACADRIVRNNRRINPISIRINAAAESAAEQIDAHDAEDEPKHEADEQYVEYCWNGLDQCIDDDLRTRQTITSL